MRCAPQSAWISVHGHAPHLLALGLEEVRGRAASRSARRRSPRASTCPSAGGSAPRGTRATQRTASIGPRFRSAFIGDDRVVVELAAVVDAAQARAAEEVVRAEDLEPEVVDRLHLGEEAVAADVEAPAVALRGAADAADDGVGLEDGRRHPALGEHVRRGEPGGPGADDDDLVLRAVMGSYGRCARIQRSSAGPLSKLLMRA